MGGKKKVGAAVKAALNLLKNIGEASRGGSRREPEYEKLKKNASLLDRRHDVSLKKSLTAGEGEKTVECACELATFFWPNEKPEEKKKLVEGRRAEHEQRRGESRKMWGR